jgi:hypothetical protein
LFSTKKAVAFFEKKAPQKNFDPETPVLKTPGGPEQKFLRSFF